MQSRWLRLLWLHLLWLRLFLWCTWHVWQQVKGVRFLLLLWCTCTVGLQLRGVLLLLVKLGFELLWPWQRWPLP